MFTTVINCSNRKDGFSTLMSSAVVEHLQSDYRSFFLRDSDKQQILESVVISDLVVIASPVFSSNLCLPFWDFIDDLSISNSLPCLLIVSCGHSALFCRINVSYASKKLKDLGFSNVEVVMVDGTYSLSKGELRPRHRSRMISSCRRISSYIR